MTPDSPTGAAPSRPSPPPEPLRTEIEQAFAALREWALEMVERFAEEPATDVHDQATYLTGLEPWLAVNPDARVMAFLRATRDRIRDHFVQTDQWNHGYWRMQEAHHGTEHFELYLGMLARLDPDDPETRRQLVDAAEHFGGWERDIEPWYDHEREIYRSMHFGTDGVEVRDGVGLNVPDHFRCANIEILAAQLTGDPRYWDHAQRYVRRWAQAILAGPDPGDGQGPTLPVAIAAAGPMTSLGEAESVYRDFAGALGPIDRDIDRAENLLASAAVQTLLALWDHSRDAMFRDAARRLVQVLASQLGDPDAGAAAATLRDYRRATGDTHWDAAIRDAVRPFRQQRPSLVEATPPVQPAARKASGVGKRGDAPGWLEDGQPRRVSPVLLALAAEIDRDIELAAEAVRRGALYFEESRRRFTPGREHGCKAPTVSAVLRGHGRENHTGVATGIWGPLLQAFAQPDHPVASPADQAGPSRLSGRS